MLDLSALQEEFGNRVNTSDEGVAFREATVEDIKEVMVGEAAHFLASYDNFNSEMAKNAGIIAKQASACGNLQEFNALVSEKAHKIINRYNVARAENHKQGLANAQAAVEGLCHFIKRMQSSIGRSGYFRHMDALKQEAAVADDGVKFKDGKGYEVRSSYDGWQNLRLHPADVCEAVDEIFIENLASFNYLLQFTGVNYRRNMSGFAFSSTKVEERFVDYESREDCWKAMDEHSVALKGVSSEVESLLS